MARAASLVARHAATIGFAAKGDGTVFHGVLHDQYATWMPVVELFTIRQARTDKSP